MYIEQIQLSYIDFQETRIGLLVLLSIRQSIDYKIFHIYLFLYSSILTVDSLLLNPKDFITFLSLKRLLYIYMYHMDSVVKMSNPCQFKIS